MTGPVIIWFRWKTWIRNLFVMPFRETAPLSRVTLSLPKGTLSLSFVTLSLSKGTLSLSHVTLSLSKGTLSLSKGLLPSLFRCNP
ncbi:hypothetical protein D9M69_514330 [compost metagenome]